MHKGAGAVQPGAAIEFTYVLASAELPEFAYPTERRSDVLSITMNGEARTACFPSCVTAVVPAARKGHHIRLWLIFTSPKVHPHPVNSELSLPGVELAVLPDGQPFTFEALVPDRRDTTTWRYFKDNPYRQPRSPYSCTPPVLILSP